MDNNTYEQQFQQNVQNSMPQQPVGGMGMDKSSKIPLIVAAVLGVVVVIETIFLVIAMTNNPNVANEEDVYDDEVIEEASIEEEVDDSYVYDEDDNLIAVEATCTAENGASFALTTDNKYSQYDATSNPVGSGTYSIIESSVIPLTSANAGDPQKVLYYDGWILADGTTIYNCEEEVTEEEEVIEEE